MATKDFSVASSCEPRGIDLLAPGDLVEVFFWSLREWRIGSFEIGDDGDAYVAISGRARPLAYDAALLMGLRRLLH